MWYLAVGIVSFFGGVVATELFGASVANKIATEISNLRSDITELEQRVVSAVAALKK